MKSVIILKRKEIFSMGDIMEEQWDLLKQYIKECIEETRDENDLVIYYDILVHMAELET